MIPKLPDPDSMPWWGYLVIVVTITLVAGFAWSLRLFVKRYVIDTIPTSTVTLITTAKEAEIERARTDSANWQGAFHVKDAAYTELAQSIDDLTDALATAGRTRNQPRMEGSSNGRVQPPARRRT